MREDDSGDGLLKSERVAEVAADNACKIARVLHGNGHVQAQSVTKLGQIAGARPLTEHLLHGIARHDVNEKKNERHDEPERGESEQKPE
jgi:hypothetical protein